jgi:N-acetyl-anhydromuramyl-L-alanine amidase AmpD
LETLTIDKKTYKTKNHYKTKNPKTQIVIGSSLRWGSNHLIRLQHKEMGASKTWPTFTIRRDGLIYQHFDSKFHSDFLGIKEADKQSISIILENMVHLYKTDFGYVNFIDEWCDEKRVIKKKWLDFEHWEKYDDVQITALVKLCQMLCDLHNIPRRVIDFHHYHEKIIKYKGIVLRGNHINGSTDNNPILDIPTLKQIELAEQIS